MMNFCWERFDLAPKPNVFGWSLVLDGVVEATVGLVKIIYRQFPYWRNILMVLRHRLGILVMAIRGNIFFTTSSLFIMISTEKGGILSCLGIESI